MSTSYTTYRHCLAESNSRNETNDCSVTALAITTGIRYDKAHKIMAMMGRKPGKGPACRVNGKRTYKSMHDTMRMAIKVAGRQAGIPETPQGYTMNTIGERYSHGSYLVFTRGHVAAVVDGVVEDWTKGRKHRVTHVIRVGV